MEIHIVTFEASDKNTPMTRLKGKISFPEHWGIQPEIGEKWEVQLAGVSRSGAVNFLHLVRKIETRTERRIFVPDQDDSRSQEWEDDIYFLEREYEVDQFDFERGTISFRPLYGGDRVIVHFHAIDFTRDR